MNDTLTRYAQLDNWVFEVKTVRAIRVDCYGKPYSATANFSLNGANGFIDGLMTREQDDFSREDYQTFKKFFQQMQVKQVSFDRFKSDKLVTEVIAVIPPDRESPLLKLVR